MSRPAMPARTGVHLSTYFSSVTLNTLDTKENCKQSRISSSVFIKFVWLPPHRPTAFRSGDWCTHIGTQTTLSVFIAAAYYFHVDKSLLSCQLHLVVCVKYWHKCTENVDHIHYCSMCIQPNVAIRRNNV
jgi:hypothetical protein